MSQIIYTTASDWYHTPKGFNKELFLKFNRNQCYESKLEKNPSKVLSNFMKDCYHSKLKIASASEDVTQTDVENAVAFDVLYELQNSDSEIQNQLYTKLKQSFEDKPELTKAVLRKDIRKKAENYDKKTGEEKNDPTFRSILDVERVRDELVNGKDLCSSMCAKVLEDYDTSYIANDKKIEEEKKRLKENKNKYNSLIHSNEDAPGLGGR